MTTDDRNELADIREPTPEMIRAGLGQLHKTREIAPEDAVKAIFRAMIDQALRRST